jgi:hypothetical protein
MSNGNRNWALDWNWQGRLAVFFLSATSIWCLLAELYGLCSMRLFTLWILIPSSALLVAIALLDRASGRGTLSRAVLIGALGGLLAAVAYDLFRLPFVVADIHQIGPASMRLPLFKVFPRFGAMILGETFSAAQADSQFSWAAHWVGWAYHFSNGIAFGVMYMAMVGDAGRRSWAWAVLLATGIELAMLFTPYTTYFGLHSSFRFVLVTLAAHIVFGLALGLYCRAQARRLHAATA